MDQLVNPYLRLPHSFVEWPNIKKHLEDFCSKEGGISVGECSALIKTLFTLLHPSSRPIRTEKCIMRAAENLSKSLGVEITPIITAAFKCMCERILYISSCLPPKMEKTTHGFAGRKEWVLTRRQASGLLGCGIFQLLTNRFNFLYMRTGDGGRKFEFILNYFYISAFETTSTLDNIYIIIKRNDSLSVLRDLGVEVSDKFVEAEELKYRQSIIKKMQKSLSKDEKEEIIASTISPCGDSGTYADVIRASLIEDKNSHPQSYVPSVLSTMLASHVRSLKTPIDASLVTIAPSHASMLDSSVHKSHVVHDFSSRKVGGGVLNAGCVQEEIYMSQCPELITSVLLCTPLKHDESVWVSGALPYGDFTGYKNTFHCTHPFTYEELILSDMEKSEKEKVPLDLEDLRDIKCISTGDELKHLSLPSMSPESMETPTISVQTRDVTCVVADALRCASVPLQYQLIDLFVDRELVKLMVTFSDPRLPKLTAPLAGGQFGCGVFKGDPYLKGLLQIIVASCLGVKLELYPFNNDKVHSIWSRILESCNGISISDVMKLIEDCRAMVGIEKEGMYEKMASIRKKSRAPWRKKGKRGEEKKEEEKMTEEKSKKPLTFVDVFFEALESFKKK
ncbi:Poly(ADP-ribose) glycohydrolase like protein [Aduncisulcus paluster]|uniref:Poly(ADP-ribose) glycohydrolase like protein n=1 Tax=Aduncisulcus paluster TaxID=2918883 RepID=A0ABQ5KP92_9EUKA|nr:Poly(ADP-ribose) glycohydrolase like protein [Aduncisulcus paluster]